MFQVQYLHRGSIKNLLAARLCAVYIFTVGERIVLNLKYSDKILFSLHQNISNGIKKEEGPLNTQLLVVNQSSLFYWLACFPLPVAIINQRQTESFREDKKKEKEKAFALPLEYKSIKFISGQNPVELLKQASLSFYKKERKLY